MTASRTGFTCLATAMLLFGSGCSMFRDRPQAPAAEATPESEEMRAATKLATDFYEMRARLGRTGLPDETEMKAYRAFLCPALATAMDEARVRQKAWIAAHPDEKPPLIEGDLFSSLFEGTDVVTPSGTEVQGESARVNLSMRFGEGEGAARWRDAVLLEKDQGSWCIADVEYRGDWPFANKGKLSSTLAEPF